MRPSIVVALAVLLGGACVDAPPTDTTAAASVVECNVATIGQPCDNDDNLCTLGRCEAVRGGALCVSDGTAPDGTVCESDGDGCTVDTCSAGQCQHELAPWCAVDAAVADAAAADARISVVDEPPDGGSIDAASPDAATDDTDAGFHVEGEIGGGGLGVGGCGVSSRPGLGSAVLAALLVVTRRRRATVAALLVVVSVGAAREARAQVDVGVYRPASPGAGGFAAEGVTTLPRGALDAGVWFDAARDVLVVRDPDTGALLPGGLLIGSRATAYLGVAVGALPGVELSAQLPLVLDQQGDLSMTGGGGLPARAAGDLELRAKLRVAAGHGWGLAALVSGTLPSGDARAFSHDARTTIGARLLAGVRLGRVALSLGAGRRWRPAQTYGDLQIGDEWTGEAGVQIELARQRLWLAIDAYVAAGASEVPAEVLAGPRVRVLGPWVAQAGVGVGLTHGYGTPSLRGVALVAWAPDRQRAVHTPHPAPPPARMARRPRPAPAPDEAIAADHDLLRDRDDPFAPPPPTEEAFRLVLEDGLLFDTARARVKTRAQKKLRGVLAEWAQHPEWDRVVLEGHTDEVGGDDYNDWLGLERATRVRRFLIAQGAPADRISVVSFGKRRPIVEGHDRRAQQRNRRVELVVVKDRRDAEPPDGHAEAGAALQR